MAIDSWEALAQAATGPASPLQSVDPIPTVVPIPSIVKQEAGETGHRTLWAVFVIMLLSSLVMYVQAYRVPVGKRFFHVLTSLITTFAAVSYYAMATGDGITPHSTTIKEESANGLPPTYTTVVREVYWARYVDWSVTTPLLLIDLAILAGLPGANIFVAVVADILMVLTGLFAAFARGGSNTWGYYAIACIAYLVIVYQLGFNGRASIKSKDSKTVTFYYSIAGFTLILWTLYPIIWGVADGSRILDVNGEIIAYAVLDVLAKPVFGLWLLFTHDAMSQSSITLGGFWAHGLTSEGAIRVGDDDEGA